MQGLVESVGGYAATLAVTLLAYYLQTRYMKPRSRLIVGTPRNFDLKIDDHRAPLAVSMWIIRNLSWRPVEGVDILHKVRPDFFEFRPSVNYTEKQERENQQHVITITSFGARESVVLQVASQSGSTGFLGVRSRDGRAKTVEVEAVQERPRWAMLLGTLLKVIGIGSVAYVGLRFAIAGFAP